MPNGPSELERSSPAPVDTAEPILQTGKSWLATRLRLVTFFTGGLFVLAILGASFAASAIVLPLVLAVFLKLLLQPIVSLLQRFFVPRALGAILPIVLVVGILVGLVAALSAPAATWAQKLPQGVPRLEEHLMVLSGPMHKLQGALEVAEEIANAPQQGRETVAVRSDLGIAGALFAGTKAVLDGLITTVLVLYFLLLSGDTFLRRIVEILPTFADKRQAVEIFQEIESDISVYLLTITIMNAAVGLATAAVMYACGLQDVLLWGTMAFLLNFVPFLGPLLGVGIFLMVGLLTFDSLWWGLLAPALYFGIHLIEGETLTPFLLARRFTLNPALVVLSLIFWFWMWGAPGALLAFPLLAILKIVSDRLRPLRPLGHLLEQ
ncbi:conserved membrane hypothetical protein [Mesorhizobium sp. ORS 3324]|nr:conserved membrane hypothetical protein [Mesorhizobium sp. ORS 3324]